MLRSDELRGPDEALVRFWGNHPIVDIFSSTILLRFLVMVVS